MALETFYKTVKNNGEYSCGDIGITAKEWYSLLQDDKARPYLETLLCFFREPDRKGSCAEVSKKYGKPAQYYNSKVTNFSKWVQKKLNRFKVIDTDGDNTYWCIAMQSGWETKHGFLWQLRNELSEALEEYLMRGLIHEFQSREPFNGYDEKYKWALINATRDKNGVGIAKSIISLKVNLIDNVRNSSILKFLANNKTDEFENYCNRLFDESIPLNDRIAGFKSEMREICPDKWKSCANDERTASALLTCKYPDKYTFYMDEVYQIICQYFGYESRKPGVKFSHFIEIINNFVNQYGNEVQDIISEQIVEFKDKPINLAIQTLFWCMKEYMKKQMNKKMKFTWIPFYKEFSEKLLEYKDNRTELIEFIYAKDGLENYTNYMHTSDNSQKIDDIDPFSFYGIFNTSNKRNAKLENRQDILAKIKDRFSIVSDIPSDFDGIPVLNFHRSFYYNWDDVKNSCNLLWRAFENLMKNDSLEEYFKYNKFSTRKSETTMPLFWIKPENYIALDSNNKSYLLQKYDIDTLDVVDYESYIKLINTLREAMKSNKIKEKSFYDLSANAVNYENNDEPVITWYDDIVETWKKRKSIVLYGAPGTGKTHDVPELAVRLCDPDFDAVGADRKELMDRYNQLKKEKRIAFTTFHQSMDYEDWIEGLRPMVNDNNLVTYEIVNGIFKQLCEAAERPTVKDKQIGIADDAVVWKVSLMGTGDNLVRSDCMKNSYIRIGWDDYGPIISDETDWSIYHGEGKQILDAFINKMKVGDIVLSCYSNHTIDAIGVVIGEYEYQESLPKLKRVRKVNWILKGVNEDIVEMNNGKTLTLSTVYRLNSITLDDVKSILDKYKKPTTMETNTKPYVMVIDEMNRGNVSKIFGELITLLEVDKRKGCCNAESVILPYSKESFQIPKNVFLIATMNTADRSLGTLDYAIRRRFTFIAEKPISLEGEVEGFNVELFKMVSNLFVSNYDEYEESGWVQSFKLEPAETLSEEYRPEDVWIGQSYFIMTDEDGDDITSDRLLYEIIPLLEEYVRDGVLTSDAQVTIDKLYKIATE